MTSPDPLAPIIDDPALPRVLLLGDSISIGYTISVRQLLRAKANVHRPPENCDWSGNGLKKLDEWLGLTKWDVIHFNFGLHDIKHLDDQGNYVSPAIGKRVSTLAEYERNLQGIVARLKSTGAFVIWCATTPVPEGALARIPGTEKEINQIAAKVMQQHGIAINDLWTVAAGDIERIQQPQNVHFTDEGYGVLAKAVAASIEAALKSHRPLQPSKP